MIKRQKILVFLTYSSNNYHSADDKKCNPKFSYQRRMLIGFFHPAFEKMPRHFTHYILTNGNDRQTIWLKFNQRISANLNNKITAKLSPCNVTETFIAVYTPPLKYLSQKLAIQFLMPPSFWPKYFCPSPPFPIIVLKLI